MAPADPDAPRPYRTFPSKTLAIIYHDLGERRPVWGQRMAVLQSEIDALVREEPKTEEIVRKLAARREEYRRTVNEWVDLRSERKILLQEMDHRNREEAEDKLKFLAEEKLREG